MVYSLTAQLRLWRSHLLWKHWKLFLQLSQTSLCDDSSEHSDHTAKTFRRLLWSKKFSPYCGENLGGVKRHLWLGADTAGGVGGGGVMACGRISRPANCPAPDQNCPRIFGSPDPSVLSPRRSSWLSEARPSYRPLFAPTVISNVRSSQSWICTLSDRKWRETMQCRRPTWKRGKFICEFLPAPGSRPRAIVTWRVSVAPSGWENPAAPSGREISGRLLFQGYWFTCTNVLTHLWCWCRHKVNWRAPTSWAFHAEFAPQKSLSLEMWCRSRIHAIHIIPIFAQHTEWKKILESSCFTQSCSALFPLGTSFPSHWRICIFYKIIWPRYQSIPTSLVRIGRSSSWLIDQ